MGPYEEMVRALCRWHEADLRVTTDEEYVGPGQTAWYFVSMRETEVQRQVKRMFENGYTWYGSGNDGIVFDGDGGFGMEEACMKLLEKYVGPKREVYYVLTSVWEIKPNSRDYQNRFFERKRKPLIQASSVEELRLKMEALDLV